MRSFKSCQSEINRLKEELTEATRENTVRLESLVDLTDAKQKLEADLNAAQLSVVSFVSIDTTSQLLVGKTLTCHTRPRSTRVPSIKILLSGRL